MNNRLKARLLSGISAILFLVVLFCLHKRNMSDRTNKLSDRILLKIGEYTVHTGTFINKSNGPESNTELFDLFIEAGLIYNYGLEHYYRANTHLQHKIQEEESRFTIHLVKDDKFTVVCSSDRFLRHSYDVNYYFVPSTIKLSKNELLEKCKNAVWLVKQVESDAIFYQKQTIVRQTVPRELFKIINRLKDNDFGIMESGHGDYHIVQLLGKYNYVSDKHKDKINNRNYFGWDDIWLNELYLESKLKINAELLHQIDYSIRPLHDNENIAALGNRTISVQELSEKTKDLSFDFRKLLINKNTRVMAIAYLLTNDDKYLENRGLYEKKIIEGDSNPDVDHLSINYDLLMKQKFYTYVPGDIIAKSGRHYMTVNEVTVKMEQLTEETRQELIKNQNINILVKLCFTKKCDVQHIILNNNIIEQLRIGVINSFYEDADSTKIAKIDSVNYTAAWFRERLYMSGYKKLHAEELINVAKNLIKEDFLLNEMYKKHLLTEQMKYTIANLRYHMIIEETYNNLLRHSCAFFRLRNNKVIPDDEINNKSLDQEMDNLVRDRLKCDKIWVNYKYANELGITINNSKYKTYLIDLYKN
jgi:hypothetical protein